jgi:antitoxin ParD1/3/4
MPTRNVHLTEHFDNFIEAGVQSGLFSNASEVVREGLRLLQQRQEEEKAKLDWLRGAIQDGINAVEQGEYTLLSSANATTEYLHKIRTR